MTSLYDSMRNPLVTVYGLVDPRDDSVRYVGKTENSLSSRYSYHYRRSLDGRDQSRKAAWIKSLDAAGLKPEIEVLEIVGQDDWQEAERNWIALYNSPKLTNHTPGGEVGALGFKNSPEQRKRKSDAAKRRCADPAERERLRQISLAGPPPPVHIGERNPQAKLSDLQVVQMREENALGKFTRQELADRYDTSTASISNILTGKTRASAAGPIVERQVKVKLSDSDIEEIVKASVKGATQKSIAELYGVTQSNISRILAQNRR